MPLATVATIAICAAIPLVIIACAIYRLSTAAAKTSRSLEIGTNLQLDLKVFSVAALCYLKTLHDQHNQNDGSNPSKPLILAAEQMTAAVLVEAGIDARAYNLRHILQAIDQSYVLKRA